MTYVVTQQCVDLKDLSCVEECPVDCIYEGARSMYVQPDECIDCGACMFACPVGAVLPEGDAPEGWVRANREFFDGLGSPGGASVLGPSSHDAPLVMSTAVETGAPLPRAVRSACSSSTWSSVPQE